MLRRFSLQVIEKQHRMMEQLGSQIKVFIFYTFTQTNTQIHGAKLFCCLTDSLLPSLSHLIDTLPLPACSQRCYSRDL